VQKHEFRYRVGVKEFIGFVAYDESIVSKIPAVLIVHAFDGCTKVMKEYAVEMAKKGYLGFAIDVYGAGATGTTLDECLALIHSCPERVMIVERLKAAVAAVKELPQCDTDKIVAIGFCFGGRCVLDLARTGFNINGVVSVHGIFAQDEKIQTQKITASILALHGYKDPQVPLEDLPKFANEMIAAEADWQMHYFGNALHAFTDVDAAEIGGAEIGRVYDPLAADRSWKLIDLFLQEKFHG
jgi:dienelactone hydrolase